MCVDRGVGCDFWVLSGQDFSLICFFLGPRYFPGFAKADFLFWALLRYLLGNILLFFLGFWKANPSTWVRGIFGTLPKLAYKRQPLDQREVFALIYSEEVGTRYLVFA